MLLIIGILIVIYYTLLPSNGIMIAVGAIFILRGILELVALIAEEI